MMWWFDGWSSWWAVPMLLGMLVFWAVVIWAVVAVARAIGGASSTERPVGATPEQILAERFARGEIDADEYQRRLATLRAEHRSEP